MLCDGRKGGRQTLSSGSDEQPANFNTASTQKLQTHTVLRLAQLVSESVPTGRTPTKTDGQGGGEPGVRQAARQRPGWTRAANHEAYRW